MASIVAAEAEYRAWLQGQLGREFRAKDYERRLARMAEGPFPFLRATYWRWCDYPLGFSRHRRVLSVGDIHIENFGTWRDADGRLVFGVNDLDEAAVMQWPHDLVRLLASARLAAQDRVLGPGMTTMARALLAGYRHGLAERRPVILDGTSGLWDMLVLTSVAAHQAFWAEERRDLNKRRARPPARYRAALRDAFPPGAELGEPYARKAGTGSLGRPRFAVIGEYRGGPVLREVKRLLPSSWSVRIGEEPPRNRTREAASLPTRAPDPWFAVVGAIAVRRLSPNNRKIEIDKAETDPPCLPLPLRPEVLYAMGRDIGAMHGARAEDAEAIAASLEAEHPGTAWLTNRAERLAEIVERDHAEWKGSRGTAD
ncbi:DUF2252 family protein [Neoroseomonas lacus]|uniref:DUF2252 domain-containing protein n=1 Tax=Neoroseomonas lacus TaxID=287609 RepID=A0A917KSX6_9PROT|nr:DUF2252 family protein [Neoroseomonas lacus]GGJ24936.1 hypothetical protein GCM10011320_35340 [Neoroseomonas lacus]